MADKVPCADSKTVEELFRCISKTYGVPLPKRRDMGNDPLWVDFFNLPVEVAQEKLFELYADVNPGKPSRWPVAERARRRAVSYTKLRAARHSAKVSAM